MNKSKRIKSIIFLTFILITTLTSYNCERDDICAESTPTTPRLIIEFYDATEQDELKSVTRLTVYGDGLTDNPTDGNTEGILIFNTNSRIIELPLLIGAEGETITSRFILEKDTNLRLDENVNTNSNIDIIEIAYETEFIYVSRACGYKSIFNLIDVDINPDGDDDDLWIEDVEIIENLVENENTVHVHIFH